MLVLKIIKQSLKHMYQSDSQLKDFCYICYYLKQVFKVSFSFFVSIQWYLYQYKEIVSRFF